jgi:hypothetical protein
MSDRKQPNGVWHWGLGLTGVFSQVEPNRSDLLSSFSRPHSRPVDGTRRISGGDGLPRRLRRSPV